MQMSAGKQGIGLPCASYATKLKALALPSTNGHSITSPISLTSTLPLLQLLSDLTISTNTFSGIEPLHSFGRSFTETNSKVSTEVDSYDTSKATEFSSARVLVSTSTSIVDANKAAPRATAVIGSMLVSTFGVTCSLSI